MAMYRRGREATLRFLRQGIACRAEARRYRNCASLGKLGTSRMTDFGRARHGQFLAPCKPYALVQAAANLARSHSTTPLVWKRNGLSWICRKWAETLA